MQWYSQHIQILEAHTLPSDQQHGFHKRRRYESRFIFTHRDLARMGEGQNTNVIFLYISEAFNKATHKRLNIKLEDYEIRRWTFRKIQSFLSIRKPTGPCCRAIIRLCHSNLWSLLMRLIGSPICLLYINGLVKRTGFTASLFADGCDFTYCRHSYPIEGLGQTLTMGKWLADVVQPKKMGSYQGN